MDGQGREVVNIAKSKIWKFVFERSKPDASFSSFSPQRSIKDKFFYMSEKAEMTPICSKM